MQDIHDGQARVQPNKVGQRQGPHGHISPILHNAVDVLTRANTSLKADDRLIDVRHEDAVRKETRRIRGHRCDLAHTLDKRNRSVNGLLGRLQTSDNLHALLDGDWVHEMGRDNPGRRLKVCRICGCGGRDLGYRDGRCVCGENCMLRRDLGKLGEYGCLQVWNFGDGFDNKIYRGEVVQIQTRCDTAACGICRLLCNAVFGHILFKELIYGELAKGRYRGRSYAPANFRPLSSDA